MTLYVDWTFSCDNCELCHSILMERVSENDIIQKVPEKLPNGWKRSLDGRHFCSHCWLDFKYPETVKKHEYCICGVVVGVQ